MTNETTHGGADMHAEYDNPTEEYMAERVKPCRCGHSDLDISYRLEWILIATVKCRTCNRINYGTDPERVIKDWNARWNTR